MTWAEPAALGFLALGLIVGIGILARANEDDRWWSSAMVYVALGLAAAVAIDGLDVGWIDIEEDTAVIEHVAEAAVVVTLYATGLQIDRDLNLVAWRSVLLLLLVAMPLTVAAVALLGMGLLGLSLGAAIVLGAALAPTDPVLAGDVGVGPPGEDDPEARFSLTAEASFNDGLAFPFLIAGLAIAADGGTGWIGSWLAIDVAYKLVVGLLVGAVLGHLAAGVVLPLRSSERLNADLDGWLTVAIALAVYGVAQVLSSYGFLAAIAAGLAFRRREKDHAKHEELHAGAQRIVQLLELGTIVLVASSLTLSGLGVPGWKGWLLGALLVFVVRPVAAAATLGNWCLDSGTERRFVAFFGVRGLGSVYYVAAAVGTGTLAAGEAQLVLWTVMATVLVSIVVHGISAKAGLMSLKRDAAASG
ncbi:cation:proton antiporter [Paraconexibacter sp. AEG42_29]|uniref:cation:proton antiporter n=1 Tax=Paraconexibacter sp. AEG42_29 TaxID=2997339 RepID=UPI00339D63F1